jgi:S1-C subfamily serine protease
MRTLVAGAAGLLCLAGVVRADDAIPPEVLDAVKHATTFVTVQGSGVSACGSGFVIKVDGDKTLLVTNHHVIEPTVEVELNFPDLLPRPFGPRPLLPHLPMPIFRMPRTVQATIKHTSVSVIFDSGTKAERVAHGEVLAIDADYDLAVLRVSALKSPPAPIDPAREVTPRETMPVYTFGFPFGKILSGNKGNPAITIGKAAVSSLREDDDGDLDTVQLDGNINPGNSGGPVVDTRGQLIGIVVAVIRNSRGIALAIPAERLRRVLRGRLGTPQLAVTREAEGKTTVRAEVSVIDPLNRIRSVALHYLPPQPGQETPGPDQALEALPDCRKVPLTLERQLAADDFVVEGGVGGKSLLVQGVYVTEGGKTLRSRATSVVVRPKAAPPPAATSRADEPGPAVTPPPVQQLFTKGPLVYLADLQEFGVRAGPWPFGKTGKINDGRDIQVSGVRSPHGLSMHPPTAPSYASARYRLGKQAALFKATAAINDTTQWTWSPATFTVWGDGKLLWKSQPLAHTMARLDECRVDVSGVDVLEVRVAVLNGNTGDHAVWFEPRLLQKADTSDPVKPPPAAAGPPAAPPQAPGDPGPVITPPPVQQFFTKWPLVYLAELQEFGVQAGGPWAFGKTGTVGDGHAIEVNGVRSPHGLSMHPPWAPRYASVRYRLGKQAALFKATAAINDTTKWTWSPATFTVWGDGKLLWQSKPLAHTMARVDDCRVDVSEVDVLELRVTALNGSDGDHAVWVEPRLLQKADTPDIEPASVLFAHGPREYLSDLDEFDVRVGSGPFSRNGVIGPEHRRIKVNGARSPKALGLPPPDAPGQASVKYRLGKLAAVFKAVVALDDAAQVVPSKAVFEVYGDGRRLWQSEPVGKGTPPQECRVDVLGVDVLEVRVSSQGAHDGLHAVWLEPRLLQKVDTSDP